MLLCTQGNLKEGKFIPFDKYYPPTDPTPKLRMCPVTDNNPEYNLQSCQYEGWDPEGVLQALKNNITKIYNARNHIHNENFKLKLCACAQSHALGTRTKVHLEILIRSTISEIHKFWENILQSSQNISETTPCWHHSWWAAKMSAE